MELGLSIGFIANFIVPASLISYRPRPLSGQRKRELPGHEVGQDGSAQIFRSLFATSSSILRHIARHQWSITEAFDDRIR